MRTIILTVSLLLFLAATLLSIAGSSWNDYAHHTALTGIAQVLFVAAFLPVWSSLKSKRKSTREQSQKSKEL